MAMDKLLSKEALAELRDWLMNGAPTCGNQTYVAGVVGTRDVEKLLGHIDTLQSMIDEALEHRDFDSLVPF